jgi:hypothetical protein
MCSGTSSRDLGPEAPGLGDELLEHEAARHGHDVGADAAKPTRPEPHLIGRKTEPGELPGIPVRVARPFRCREIDAAHVGHDRRARIRAARHDDPARDRLAADVDAPVLVAALHGEPRRAELLPEDAEIGDGEIRAEKARHDALEAGAICKREPFVEGK